MCRPFKCAACDVSTLFAILLVDYEGRFVIIQRISWFDSAAWRVANGRHPPHRHPPPRKMYFLQNLLYQIVELQAKHDNVIRPTERKKLLGNGIPSTDVSFFA